MNRTSICMLLLFVTFVLGFRPLQAQEFRISTRVFNEGMIDESGRSPVISRSLTLFHAGKVYDYLDSIGEVIVLEPNHNRVTILNTNRHMATTVEFDEIKRMLKLREQETETYIQEQFSQDADRADEVSRMLTFQLTPEFEQHFEEDGSRLVLESPILTYDVKCAAPRHADALAPYVAYADWMARLNSILHPQSLFPAPRIALNQALKERGQLPIEVQLTANLETRLQLKAQHTFGWQLDTLDRRLIHKWETALRSENLEKLTLHDYQRRILLTDFDDRR